jgi:hypothetical protein
MNKHGLDSWLVEIDSYPELVLFFVIAGLSLLLVFNELLH